jgi:hypothetical protein
MSSVNFGGPLNFGSATYTDIVTRQASDWEAAKMSNAVVYLDVFDATTGHLMKQVQLQRLCDPKGILWPLTAY